MECLFDRHLGNEELDALVPSSRETAGWELQGLCADVVREAERHLESCGDCRRKVEKYRQLVSQLSNVAVSGIAQPGPDCPNDEDVDWHEVATGLWPELKATQLIMHAALCDHCGPLLRAATSVDDGPTPQEEERLAELNAPSRAGVKGKRESIPSCSLSPSVWRQFLQWKMLVPAVALMVLVGVLGTRSLTSPRPLSGARFAEFAVSTHRQHAQALRLSVDAADVPLQRLVFSLDLVGGRRHACLLAPGARAGDV